jgi:hypothetical protein
MCYMVGPLVIVGGEVGNLFVFGEFKSTFGMLLMLNYGKLLGISFIFTLFYFIVSVFCYGLNKKSF